ncbi:MAG: amidohydrolase [Erysipelotrichaceae bacterium]|nr:amidohydrolase [Erysipelotrichaceae bacterium]
MSVLFCNARILLRNSEGYTSIVGYLGVDKEYIDYIGEEKPIRKYDEEKDYTNRLIMPGLYNSHTHSPMVFMRGIANGYSLEEWLNDRIFPIESKMKAKHIEAASFYAILEMIASGIVSFTDMYFFPEETAKAVIASGMKANINKYLLCFDEEQTIEDSMIPSSVAFYDEYNNKASGRLKVDFAIHAQYTCKPHIVKEYGRLCKEKGAIMHIHCSESETEMNGSNENYGVTPVKWFEDLGVLENPVVAAHCVLVNDEDIEIMKKYHVSPVHNPTSNLMLGNGFMPLRKCLDAGLNVGIGTDGTASNNNLNLFEEMHIASIIHNGINHDPKCIASKEIIDMATVNGAKLQGREKCGEIKEGYKADLIALKLDNIHTYPFFDIAVEITHTLQASDICMNMVDGKILYEDGEYLTLDKDKIVKEFKEMVEEFHA